MMNPWTRRGALVAALLGASLGGASVATAQPAPDAGLVAEPSCVKPKGKITVSLAQRLRLQDLVTWAQGFTCKTFVYDARLADRMASVELAVNFAATSAAMTPKQAYALFQESLRALDVKAVGKGAVVRLMDTAPPQTACGDADSTTGALKAGIKRSDDTHFEITRALIDQILADPIALAKGARAVPVIRGGQPDGFKLYAIRPMSIYRRLGFENGDTLRAVNGVDLNSPDQALELYRTLHEASSLRVDVTRRGKPVTLTITIK